MKLDLPLAHTLDAGIWYSTAASSCYPTHWHDELELNLVLWGSARYEIENRTVELGPGSLLLLAPGQRHTLLGVSDDLAMWVTSLRLAAVRDAEAMSGVRFLGRRPWSDRSLSSAQLRELSLLHAQLWRCDDACQLNSRSRQLLALALRYWQASHDVRDDMAGRAAHAPRPPHGAVARARTLLREPDGPASLAILSRRCGLEASRLSRLFKQQMGLSMVQFRNHFRVQQFIGRFGRGEHATMLAAALQCGFGSYPQFHRAFHQVTGYAPSEHIRRVHAGIVAPLPQGLLLAAKG
ncbi:MAG: AraC family transcriptional regulator [Polyangiaceae bacterium]